MRVWGRTKAPFHVKVLLKAVSCVPSTKAGKFAIVEYEAPDAVEEEL